VEWDVEPYTRTTFMFKKAGIHYTYVSLLADPSWVSINRGVLVCDGCCSVHLSLGRHVSQIKSLKKGSWSPQQLTVGFAAVLVGLTLVAFACFTASAFIASLWCIYLIHALHTYRCILLHHQLKWCIAIGLNSVTCHLL